MYSSKTKNDDLKKWFEMEERKRKKYNNSVWVPLKSQETIIKEGKIGNVGFKKEFLYNGSIAFPIDKKEEAVKLKWMDIGIHNQKSWYDDKYYPCDAYENPYNNLKGIHLVLEQEVIRENYRRWYLHQDLIFALKLEQIKDSWVCPEENYSEVARLKRDEEGNPILIEIKSEYLKDYLCARNMGIYITSYAERSLCHEDDDLIIDEENEDDMIKHEIYTRETYEGGFPFGEEIAVFNTWRTDVEEYDEIPDLSAEPSDENIEQVNYIKKFEGKKVLTTYSRLWFNEWVEAGKLSPRVRGDYIESNVEFIIDASGSKIKGNDLRNSGKWLWFKPEVISHLYNQRDGKLEFYSKDTGEISYLYSYDTVFGINDLGYINVYAEDIWMLSELEKKLWSSYNITPEGGISKELYMSQVLAKSANTSAPDFYLEKLLTNLNSLSSSLFGIKLFREHFEISKILKTIHRFRVFKEDDIYDLSKDIARVIIDDLNKEEILKILPKNKEYKKLGSIKLLEKVLELKISNDDVRNITKPIVGIYELRHCSAHLPSSEKDKIFNLVEIDRNKPYIFQGYELILDCVKSLSEIEYIFKNWHRFKDNI